MERFPQHKTILTLAFLLAVIPLTAHAEVLESDNFKVLDPVISIGGGTKSTSTNFSLVQTFGGLAIGTSSITSFQVFSNFLEWPTVTKPSSVSASAGDASASLSWSASITTGGWSVGGYSVGQSTSSGGPYSYSSVGNVTSTTASGLTNGTTYYFVIVTEDAFGSHIATSTEVSATPQAAAEEDDSSGGGGGGVVVGIIETIRDVFAPEPAEEPLTEVAERFDLNRDGLINLADISILFYCWETREGVQPSQSERARCLERADFNGDGRVSIADLSILLYYVGERFRS